jgi:hypothetical protein
VPHGFGCGWPPSSPACAGRRRGLSRPGR